MKKPHRGLKKYYVGAFLVIVISSGMYGIHVAGGETESPVEIDDTLRKIGENFIKKSVENASSLEEAASEVGIDTDVLKRLCAVLNIRMPFEPQEVPPVVLTEREKLASNDYEATVILKYDSLSPYLLLVDKSTYSLHLLSYEGGKRTLINTYECKLGRNHGDKEREGDNRTPEGAFFFVNKYSRSDILRLVGKNMAYQYGDMAFATDFPNNIDRMQGKNGGGIWLHGTDKPFEETSPNDTRGCIVTTNEVINSLSHYITLYRTPIIVVDKLNMVPRDEIESKSSRVLNMVEEWRTAWIDKRIDDYIAFYSESFESQDMNRSQWKQRKNSIFNAYTIKRIELDHVTVFQHDEGMIVQFVQDYSASNTSGTGIKTLYLVPRGDSWGIINEHFTRI